MKTKFGYMKCENRKCGERVVVKANERETLSYTCDECGKSAYAKKGAREHGDWQSEIERAPAAAAASSSSSAAASSSSSSSSAAAKNDKQDKKDKPAEKELGVW